MDVNKMEGEKKESKYKYLNTDEINNLVYIFNTIKKSKEEEVSINSLERFLLKNHNKSICDDLLSFFHVYGSTIKIDDFLHYLNCDMNQLKSKEKIRTMFELMDSNKKGFISSKSFIQAAKEFDNEFDEDTLRQIFSIVDLGNTDKLLFDEFKNSISNI
ncbi:calcium-binding protein, putative [Plasmodium ovale]|nr:calcium-binding protein, putative [Plasmodium ovale]